MAFVVAVTLALDQLVKGLVVGSIERGDRVEVLPFLDFVHVMNEGVAFGFLGDASRGLVLAVAGGALLFVLGWFLHDPRRPWSWLAIGLLVGGAAGNLLDRLLRAGVVDYIDFPAWPSFNVADIAITIGAVILVLSAVGGGDDESPEQEAPTGAT